MASDFLRNRFLTVAALIRHDLELLAAQAERLVLTLLGYCLMDNHMHLVGTPAVEESLALALGRAHYLWTPAKWGKEKGALVNGTAVGSRTRAPEYRQSSPQAFGVSP